MPLHLLSKKSWNIYNPAAQERIAKDEAAAAAKEAENDRRMQEYDSERRLAILRGEEEAPPPLPPPELKDERSVKRVRDDGGSSASDFRKRRRLQGEDDTDRDLRLAREDMHRAESARNTLGGITAQSGSQPRDHKRIDAPITDHNGHINLFPIDSRVDSRAHKNAEVEAEKKRKERELEDQYTMRFSNAAGRDGLNSNAWYNTSVDRSSRLDSQVAYRGSKTTESKKKTEAQLKLEDEKVEAELHSMGKDAWGRPDPARHQRDAARVPSNDPLAFMKRAQTQLTKAKVDREDWEQQRVREVMRKKEKEDSRRRRRVEERRRDERSDRHRRSHRHGSGDSLDGFSLDAPADHERSKSRRHRSSSRERHRSRSDQAHNSRHHHDKERPHRRRHDEERR